MFLSMNAVPIAKLPWHEFAALASKTGFPGVDVMLAPALQDGVEKTRKLLADFKLRPGYVELPADFRGEEAPFRASLPKVEEAASFANAIGCPRMMTWIMSSSQTPKDELRRIYKRRFQECGSILARSHVKLGLEFLGPLHIRKRFTHEFIWRMPDMLEFAIECGSNVGLTLDAWHWHHAGGTVGDILKAGKDRIVVVHFDDAAKQPPEEVRDNQRLLPGEGVIDLKGFVQALAKIRYDGPLSVEVFGRGLKELPPSESAALCFKYGKAVLDRYL